MGTNTRTTSLILIIIIKAYRLMISSLLGNCCRFEPSCSVYAIQAIQTHGCLNGMRYTFLRLLRCHPWHIGGKDPVPVNHSINKEVK